MRAAVGVFAALMASAAPVGAMAAQTDAPGVISYPSTFFAGQSLNNAYDMIARLPGFTFDDGQSVRGFAGAAGNVLIDGQRPTSKTDDLQAVLKRIPSSAVERIDLIRGGAPGIDMQGKTVVANVILRKTSGLKGDYHLAYFKLEDGRDMPQGRLEGTLRKGDTIFEGSLVAAAWWDDGNGQGPRTILGPGGAVESTSHMHDRTTGWQLVSTGAVTTKLWGGDFKANLMVQDQPSHAQELDHFSPAFVAPDGTVFDGAQNEHDITDQTDGELGLHYTHPLGQGLSLELIGLQHLTRMNFNSLFEDNTDDENFTVKDNGGETIARSILHWQPNTNLAVNAGGEFAYNYVKTRTTFTDNGAQLSVPAANVLVTEKRGEAFVMSTWRATPKLQLETGVRVEDSTIASTGDVVLSDSFFFVKPRVVATWSADKDDQFRFRVEREVGQIDFGNFVAGSQLNGGGIHPGNPGIAPQWDWAFEAAYERHFWTNGALVLTARHLILNDVIDRFPAVSSSGVFDAPGNIGNGTENDFIASFTLPLDLVIPHGVLKGAGTWRLPKVTDPTTGEQRIISGQHPLDMELHFTQDLPKKNLSWGVDVFPQWVQRTYRFNEIDTATNVTWDTIWAEWKQRADISWRFEIDNLGRRPFKVSREVFDGLRTPTAVPEFTDFQVHKFGAEFLIRLAKTFGG
jgi:hypothetical protein